MKTTFARISAASVLVLVTFLGLGVLTLAQAASEPPLVSILATDHHAAEAETNPGTFTVSRTGSTETSLLVFYQLSGTAHNGVDYQELPNIVTIPTGASSATLTIKPINDTLAEGTETVVATLGPSPTASPIEPYRVGFPASDIILLADNDSPDTNRPPQVAVVTIEATDAHASEIAAVPPGLGMPQTYDPGKFVVSRTGNVSDPLEVRYEAGGTAKNGIDYAQLSGAVTIPAGSAFAEIQVGPIDDGEVEGTESVLLTLKANACDPTLPPTPGCYTLGDRRQATVMIEDNDTTPHLPPAVGIIRPVEGAMFAAPADIELVATAQGTGAWIRMVEFFAGDRRLGSVEFQVFLESFRLAWSDVPAGEYTLTAKATDSLGATAWSDPVHITVKPAGVPPITLIPKQAIWKYLDNGSDQGTTWRTPAFTDTEWKSGAAQLGFGDGDETTLLRRGEGELGFITYYFRRAFEVDNTSGISELTLRLLRDDGAVVYLNGSEVFGSNMPDGPIQFSTVAASTVGNDAENIFHVALINPHALVEGRNVLAIEVHQSAIASSDLSFDLELTAAREPGQPVPPTVNIEATDAEASEISPLVGVPPNPAVFRVTRTGETTKALKIYCRLTGTARNGVDYTELPGIVTIPEGASSAEIVVQPIDDSLVEDTESVVAAVVPLFLIDPPAATDPYTVGSHASAEAHIRDNDAPPPNTLALVKIVRPESGATFDAPAIVPIVAEVRDPDGWAGRVEFFANERKIGEQNVVFVREPDPGQLQTFSFEWKDVPAGEYTLIAKATDNREGKGLSDPVRVIVREHDPAIPVVTVVTRDGYAREGANESAELNTAAFVVRRTGETNTDLTVFYSLHGTAENGRDYETLSSSVIIPAGRHTARVGVRPVNDELKECIETVLLRLEPDPSLGPIARYTVGRPSKAAAIIVDNDQPRPHCVRLPDGLFHLCLPGSNGFGFRLECSTDLKLWTPLCTNVVTDAAIHFVDPDGNEAQRRFYRVVSESLIGLDD
jgi:Calx-beta domain-containing protein/Big-like domain-containing protein